MEAERLSGTVKRVIHHDPDSGFSVLLIEIAGRRDAATVVGTAVRIHVEDMVAASGRWVTHPKFGPQFKADLLVPQTPNTVDGVRSYLASDRVKGIGPHFAAKLVEAFGEEVFEVIENQPERLAEIPGIGPKRVAQITAGRAENKAVRDIMVFLQAHGLGAARAVRIHKAYGDDAVVRISRDPYRLARDFTGIGFRNADAIAAKLGIEPVSPLRIRAGLAHVLDRARLDGHCGLPRDDMLAATAELLAVEGALVDPVLAAEVAAEHLVADTIAGRPCLFLKSLWEDERLVAARVRALAKSGPPWRAMDLDRAVPALERRLGIRLAPGQRQAIATALTAKLVVVTGGPGVGKTTLVNGILDLLGDGLEIALCAPTGRAAKRLSESTGRPASTIHRLLDYSFPDKGFRHDEDEPLDCDLLVVDEVSMVDVPLMAALLRAVPDGAAVILVGDADQLPSVGPGRVLGDLIDSSAVPVARLTEIFRQAAQSDIVTNAHRINRGRMPRLSQTEDDGGKGDFFITGARDAEDAADKVLTIVTERIPNAFGLDPVRDVQVLSPMNNGAAGVRALNARLQQRLNGGDTVPRVERTGESLRLGDKVMQTHNNYDKEVFNGDLGVVAAIDLPARNVVIEFDGRRVDYSLSDLDEIQLAYATTIHKAQGSEYPAVVIPVLNQHHVMLKRNLIYTAITRGKRLVVLVAQQQAVRTAIAGAGEARRWSKLKEWLATG